MKRMNKTNFGIFLIGVFLMFNFTSISHGAEGTYYVKPVLAENQKEDIIDYFCFDSSKDLDTNLDVLIVNESDEEKTFTVSLLDSFTSDTINVYYDQDQTYDESLKFKFSEFGEVKEPIVIKANNNQVVTIPIKKELKDFSGTILGAINITENKAVDENKGGVTNVFAYNIPVRIDVNNSNPKDKLTYEGMELTTEKYKHILKTTFKNEQSKLIRDINFSFKVVDKSDEKEIFFEDKREGLQIAPNTIFTPKISLEKSDIVAGTYLLKIKASNDDYSKEWESEFTISKKEAEDLNNGFSVTAAKKKNFPYWLIILVIAITILIILLITLFIIYRKRKAKKAEIELTKEQAIQTTSQKVKRKKKRKKKNPNT